MEASGAQAEEKVVQGKSGEDIAAENKDGLHQPLGGDAHGKVDQRSAPDPSTQSGVPLAEDRAAGHAAHEDSGGVPPEQPSEPEVAETP